MKISLVLCTLGNRSQELIRLRESLNGQSYQNFEVIIVAQDNFLLVENIFKNSSFQYKLIKSEKKGLSYARNIGKRHISGDIYTFSDDDCWYLKDSLAIVYSDFKKLNSDVLVYKIYDPKKNIYYKDYSKRGKLIGYKNIGACSSIEIFVRKTENNFEIDFHEDFGLGSKYPSSEENLYLFDLLNGGNLIKTVDNIIVYHKAKEIVKINFGYKRLQTAKEYFKIIKPTSYLLIFLLFCIKHWFKISNKHDIIKVFFS